MPLMIPPGYMYSHQAPHLSPCQSFHHSLSYGATGSKRTWYQPGATGPIEYVPSPLTAAWYRPPS